jgi:hypothetical protein
LYIIAQSLWYPSQADTAIELPVVTSYMLVTQQSRSSILIGTSWEGTQRQYYYTFRVITQLTFKPTIDNCTILPSSMARNGIGWELPPNALFSMIMAGHEIEEVM